MAKNLYRLFLQNSHQLEQTVVTIKDGEAYLKKVPALSQIKAKDLSKGDTPGATLAFLDERTCEAKSIPEFLEALRVPLYMYNLQKTHIGYFYDSKLNRLKPATDDMVLKGIASRSDGIYLGENDKVAFEFIHDFLDRLEVAGSDFVPQLQRTAKQSDGYKSFDYSIPDSLVRLILEYHNGMVTNSSGDYFSSALAIDLDEARVDIVKSLKSYKNFREIYRFTKSFDLTQEQERERKKIAEQRETERLQLEARKASKSKQKSLGPMPEQFTIFDYLNGQK